MLSKNLIHLLTHYDVGSGPVERQKGSQLTRRDFLKKSVMTSAGLGLSSVSLLRAIAQIAEAAPSSNPAETDFAPSPEPVALQESASKYIASARKNIRNFPDGRRAIVPSEAYGNGIYARDSFYAMVGLDAPSLSEACFRWFEQTQSEDGQVRPAVAFDPADTSLGFNDDESNLIYILWAGTLHRQGTSLDQDKIAGAFSFVSTHVQDGWYISSPGDFSYWADTYRNRANDTISYNQGLYALSLRFLRELHPDLVSDDVVVQAENNYRDMFRDGLGFLPLSRFTSYQDASALLPEFLSRLYFNRGMLQDHQIQATVDSLINSASISDGGDLGGIKVISTANGGFLPSGVFAPPLNGQGEYQNGGYWPMYVLASICLAYKISGDAKYQNLADQLTQKELGTDGRSKEFLYLSAGNIGAFDPERSDYSWNALIAAAFKWAEMT